MANNPMFKNMGKMADEMKKIEGFTIAESTSMKMMGRSMDTSKEAVEIKKGAIPASAFDVAAIAKGYKKVAHPVDEDEVARWTRSSGPSWLAARLGEPGLVVADVRWYLDPARRGRDAWRAGHVPGAVFLDVDEDLSAPGGGRGLPAGRHPWPSEEQVARVMGAAGIGPGVRVVAYDDASGSVAARLWYLLRAHGHDDVAVLDGGFAKWTAEGRPLSTDVPACRARRVLRPAAAGFRGRQGRPGRHAPPAPGPRRARRRALPRRDGADRPAAGPRARARGAPPGQAT